MDGDGDGMCFWYQHYPVDFADNFVSVLYLPPIEFEVRWSLNVYGKNGCLLYTYTIDELDKMKNKTSFSFFGPASWFSTSFLLGKDSITAVKRSEIAEIDSLKSGWEQHPFDSSLCKTEPGVKPNGFNERLAEVKSYMSPHFGVEPNGFNERGWIGPGVCQEFINK
jgi:hypothetical protein